MSSTPTSAGATRAPSAIRSPNSTHPRATLVSASPRVSAGWEAANVPARSAYWSTRKATVPTTSVAYGDQVDIRAPSPSPSFPVVSLRSAAVAAKHTADASPSRAARGAPRTVRAVSARPAVTTVTASAVGSHRPSWAVVRPAVGEAAVRNSASPAARARNARQVLDAGRRRKTTAPTASVKSNSVASSGWTRARPPRLRAQAWNRVDRASRPAPATQAGRRSTRSSHRASCRGPVSPSGSSAAARRWSTEAEAFDSAASRARTTVSTPDRRHPNTDDRRRNRAGAAPCTRAGRRSHPGT